MPRIDEVRVAAEVTEVVAGDAVDIVVAGEGTTAARNQEARGRANRVVRRGTSSHHRFAEDHGVLEVAEADVVVAAVEETDVLAEINSTTTTVEAMTTRATTMTTRAVNVDSRAKSRTTPMKVAVTTVVTMIAVTVAVVIMTFVVITSLVGIIAEATMIEMMCDVRGTVDSKVASVVTRAIEVSEAEIETIEEEIEMSEAEIEEVIAVVIEAVTAVVIEAVTVVVTAEETGMNGTTGSSDHSDAVTVSDVAASREEDPVSRATSRSRPLRSTARLRKNRSPLDVHHKRVCGQPELGHMLSFLLCNEQFILLSRYIISRK